MRVLNKTNAVGGQTVVWCHDVSKEITNKRRKKKKNHCSTLPIPKNIIFKIKRWKNHDNNRREIIKVVADFHSNQVSPSDIRTCNKNLFAHIVEEMKRFLKVENNKKGNTTVPKNGWPVRLLLAISKLLTKSVSKGISNTIRNWAS